MSGAALDPVAPGDAIPAAGGGDPLADEALRVSSRTALVPAEDRRAHYARIVAAIDADHAREVRSRRWRTVREVGLTGAVVALAAAVVVMLPLRRILPVFITHNEADGTWRTSITQTDMSPSERANTTKATLWLYVNARERYASATHFSIDQPLVFVLSDRATGDLYEAEVDPKNKNSPWKRYGTRATVRLERISETLTCGAQDCDRAGTPDAYQVRYRRIERTEGQGERSAQMSSSIRFTSKNAVPQQQQVTSNPLGLQVVEYNRTEEGSQ